MGAGTPPELRGESDTVLIVLAILAALLLDLAVFAFMATH